MRSVGAALLAIGALGLLAGCAAPTPPDPDEVARWMDAQHTEDATVGAMVSLTSTTEAAEAAVREGREEGIRLEFDDDPPLGREIDVTCFGADEVTIALQVTLVSQSSTSSQSTVACGEKSTRIELPDRGGPVQAVLVNGHNEHGFGAWAATLG